MSIHASHGLTSGENDIWGSIRLSARDLPPLDAILQPRWAILEQRIHFVVSCIGEKNMRWVVMLLVLAS